MMRARTIVAYIFGVCFLCVVQLACINIGISWAGYAEVGLIALVIALYRNSSFFWFVLAGFPLVVSWYSGLPLLLDTWIYALIAAVIFLVRTFVVKENHFIVYTGMVIVATILWYSIQSLMFAGLRYFGYTHVLTRGFGETVSITLIASAIHVCLLMAYVLCERMIRQRSHLYGSRSI